MALTVETAERRLPTRGKRCAKGEPVEMTNRDMQWSRRKLRRLLLVIASDLERTAKGLRLWAR